MSRINIIVPVYNAAEYLKELLESVFNQTFDDFKIIFINDCSTDDSEAIIKNYVEKYGDKIIYEKNASNLKQGATRNVGLEISEAHAAEFTAFLDADDWIEPDYLENMILKAEQENADIVICGIERFDDVKRSTICLEAVDGRDIVLEDKENMEALAFINPAPYNKLYRSSCIKGFRYQSLKRSEDTCYFFEILQNVNKIVYTHTVLYHYRIRENSLTGSIGYDVCLSMEDGFRNLLERLNYPDINTSEELETQIFIRVACGGVCRAAFSDFSHVKEYIKDTVLYMDKVMPNWRRNKYLSFGKVYGKKPFLLKILAFLYKINMFSLFVYIYYFMLKVLRKDIRV